MGYFRGESKYQTTLLPMCLDDYVGEDSVCRVIEAYVRSLDLAALGFKHAKARGCGRPPYDPAAMLCLYIYGYMNRIRSSRRLEAETCRNLEVMWLLEELTPDDKTICNFRKDNAAALKNAFREFSLWCSCQGLYGKELVAVDGTKTRANSSRKNIHTKRGTEKQLSEIERKISGYMNALETNDAEEPGETKASAETVREILKRLNEKKDRLAGWLTKIEENGGREISVVDPDAHIMHQGGDGRPLDACYNVQAVADSRHKLVVDFEVSSCPDDKGALPKLTESAKGIMGVDTIAAVADKGYYDGGDIAGCEQNGTVVYVPKTDDYVHSPDRNYDKSSFKYDRGNDCYICPMGRRLEFKLVHGGSRLYQNNRVCKICPEHGKCTAGKSGRTVTRNQHQDALDRNNDRMRTPYGREVFRERKKIIEHPFGTTKHVWGFRQFLCRGQERVTAEQSLTFLAYNLRRVINIFRENGQNLLPAMG